MELWSLLCWFLLNYFRMKFFWLSVKRLSLSSSIGLVNGRWTVCGYCCPSLWSSPSLSPSHCMAIWWVNVGELGGKGWIVLYTTLPAIFAAAQLECMYVCALKKGLAWISFVGLKYLAKHFLSEPVLPKPCQFLLVKTLKGVHYKWKMVRCLGLGFIVALLGFFPAWRDLPVRLPVETTGMVFANLSRFLCIPAFVSLVRGWPTAVGCFLQAKSAWIYDWHKLSSLWFPNATQVFSQLAQFLDEAILLHESKLYISFMK